ncbi:MAG: SusC/RagA family TonB-linked outer membrane protein [Bacteroidales bacterium]|nr:SusC/RagA family TonB-linked outer membrane protein [Bacteroidales bacterium]
MKRITSMLVCLLLFGFSAIFAQDVQIRGSVTSAEDGSPLPGVYVRIAGTNTGTATDVDGNYQLTVAPDATIVFSSIGMKTVEVPVAGQTFINIAMEVETIEMAEVVVTALGISRERKSLGYAVQEMESDEITATGNANLSTALQGKIAGVDIKPSSGMPGASTQIVLRGARSFTDNNTPLYVVDGMPIASTADYSTENSVTGSDIANRAIDLNPDDIESINVLKGQAAAALYGIRASNGVIIITTKSGKGNVIGRPVVTFSHTSTFDEVSRNPDFQTEWAQGNYGVYTPTASLSWGPRIVDLPDDPARGGNANGYPGKFYVPQLDYPGLDPWVEPKVYNNWKDYFETGYTSTYNIGISQAFESGNYAIGAGRTAQEGIAPNSGMERLNVKGVMEMKINRLFTIGFNANYSQVDIDKLTGANDTAIAGAYSAPSSYNMKGYPFHVPGDPYTQVYYRGGSFDNPYWAAENNNFNEKTNRFFGNAYLQFFSNLGEKMDLTLKYQLGTDSYDTDYRDVFGYGHAGKTGELWAYGVTASTYNSLFTAAYNWSILNDLRFSLVLGNELNHTDTRNYEEHGVDFNFGGWNHINNANEVDATYFGRRNRTFGVYGSATIDYKSMIYLTATGRNDRVSSMPRNNRTFFYPSVSLGWVISELAPIKGSNVISYAKVRAAYAEVGQAGDYQLNSYGKPTFGGGFWLDEPIVYPIGGVNSYIPSDTQYDPNLRPQNTQAYEAGVELMFLNNRIGIDYTYSRQNVKDQIFPVPLAGSTGASELYMNGGKVHTDAHEIVFNATPVRYAGFEWNINVNFSKITNVVDELAPGVESIFLGGFVTPQVRAGVGSTYPVIYGVSFVRDDEGNIVVVDSPGAADHGMPQIGGPAVIGEVSPDFILGGTNTFSYKGLSLTATVEWKQGGQMYSGGNGLLDLYGMSERTLDRESTFIFDGVKPDGSKNDIVRGGPNDPRAIQDLYTNVLSNIDEYYIWDNSFVKIRELALRYRYPKPIYKTLQIGASVYARNILVWTELANFDPESTQGNTNMGGSFERFSVPQTTSYGFGLDFTF